MPSDTIASRSSVRVAEDPQVRVLTPRRERAPRERVLAPMDLVGADRLLEREHQPGTDRLDDRRRARLLPHRRLGVIALSRGADPHDRPAARHRRHPPAQEPALRDQHARRPGAADELVGREEDGVHGRHVDRQVGAGRGVIEAGKRAVPVQHLRDRVDVRHDPGHVRGGGEAPQLQRAVAVAAELDREVREIDTPFVVLADRDDVGAGFAPGQLVRVVLVGPDEDDGPLRARAIEVEQPDELVDRGRAARTAEHDDVVRAPVDRPVDDAAGVLAQRRGVPAGGRCLRVRVGVQGQDAGADRVFDERQ